MSLLPATRAHRAARRASFLPRRVLRRPDWRAALPCRLSWLRPMEPCIQTYFVHAWAGYHLSTMMRPRVAPAVVIVVPHDRPAYRGVHAKGCPILLAQPIEASSTSAVPRGKAPVRLQVREDCLQSTLATPAPSGRVVMALLLLANRVAGGLQRL